MNTSLRVYLVLWAVMTAGACVELILVPQVVGGLTAWGTAAGWQREVAFWNLGMLLVITPILGRPDRAAPRRAALVLCILNSLFGTNQLAAFLAAREAWGYGAGVLVNYGLLLLGVAGLWCDHAEERTDRAGEERTHRVGNR